MADFTCLVVEDSPMMRQLIVFALGRIKDLHVTEADDGVDGLRKLASARYDIILTDINMPIMDGLKLIQRVRTDRSAQGHAHHRDHDRGRKRRSRAGASKLGANAYITKPIQAPKVIATVKELLKIG